MLSYLLSVGLALASPVTWQKIVGGETHAKQRTQDFPGPLFVLKDGGYALLTLSSPEGLPGAPMAGYSLTWFDAKGTLLRHRWLGYHEGSFRGSVVQTQDGGFVTGLDNSGDAALVKFDAEGKQLWKREYEFAYRAPHEPFHTLSYLVELPDGNLKALFGRMWVTLSPDGQVLQEAYVPIEDGRSFKYVMTPDGGLVALGQTSSAVPDGATLAEKQRIWNTIDVLLDRFSADGQLLWSKKYGGNKEDSASQIWAVPGGYVIGGSTESFGLKQVGYYLLRVDDNGNKLWERAFGKDKEDLFGGDMLPTADGGFLVAPYGDKALLMKVDAQGKLQWEKRYPCGLSGALAATPDGGYLMAGRSGRCGASDSWFDVLLVKTDAQGNAGPNPKKGK